MVRMMPGRHLSSGASSCVPHPQVLRASRRRRKRARVYLARSAHGPLEAGSVAAGARTRRVRGLLRVHGQQRARSALTTAPMQEQAPWMGQVRSADALPQPAVQVETWVAKPPATSCDARGTKSAEATSRVQGVATWAGRPGASLTSGGGPLVASSSGSAGDGPRAAREARRAGEATPSSARVCVTRGSAHRAHVEAWRALSPHCPLP